MRACSILAWIGLTLGTAACAPNPMGLNTTYLDRYAEQNPVPTSILECHGFSCSETSRATLSDESWRRIASAFVPRAKDAQSERRQISRAVALMQLLVGQQTGTAVHQWTHRNKDILPNLSDPTQLDCIDEAVNTWTYLTLMEHRGLFRFHRVAKLSAAGSPIEPRNTAVVQEVGGGYFAIDPSLVDVGVPPPVIPLDSWLAHWPPDLPPNESRLKISARVSANGT